jgi:hypothetical protein
MADIALGLQAEITKAACLGKKMHPDTRARAGCAGSGAIAGLLSIVCLRFPQSTEEKYPKCINKFLVFLIRVARQRVGGRMTREPGNVFWTMTAWDDDAAMNAFRVQGAHASVMPRLLDWCNEASVAHWIQETRELPSWQDAYMRLINEGRPSKVKHPSPVHLSHQLPPPRPGRLDTTMKARRPST